MGNTKITGLKKDKIRNHMKIINTENSESSSSIELVWRYNKLISNKNDTHLGSTDEILL